MANKVATNGYLLLDSGGANSIDVSANLTSFTFTIEGKTVPVTAMGDSWEVILAGLKSWSWNATLWYDDTADGQDEKLTNLAGTSFTMLFGPSGSSPAGTTPVWSGTTVMGALTNNWNVGEAMSISISGTGSGAPTRDDTP